MLFEDLPLCLKVGLSHLGDVTDFDVGVLEVGEEEEAGRAFHVFALQSLADFELLLCLNYLHLIEQLCDLCLAAVDAVEELVFFLKDGEEALMDDGEFVNSRY